MVKLVDVRAVSAGRWPDRTPLVSTNSAPHAWRIRPHGFGRRTAMTWPQSWLVRSRQGWSAFEAARVDDDAAPVRLELKGRRRFHLHGRRRGLALRPSARPFARNQKIANRVVASKLSKAARREPVALEVGVGDATGEPARWCQIREPMTARRLLSGGRRTLRARRDRQAAADRVDCRVSGQHSRV
jgi:hypothetical protein